MTVREIESAIAARGWSYDVASETFRDGERVLMPDEVLAALPDASPDELASFMDANYDRYVAQG